MSFSVSPLCGNFLMLRTPVTINGKQAEAMCDDHGWLTLSNGSPNMEVTFNSFVEDIDNVLKNNGMEGISNYWCEAAPLFQVKASSREDLKCLLNLQEKIQQEMSSKISAQLVEKLQTHDLSPAPQVEVCPEVYIMIPDYRRMDGKLIPVKEETIGSCMALCGENGLLDFGVHFMALHKNPTKEDKGPDNIVQLENDLKMVVDWFHLGLKIGVPPWKLKSIEMAHPNFPEQCRSDVFLYYMQQTVDKKWHTIVQALVNIGQRTLAIKIALKYGVPVPQVNKDEQEPENTEMSGASQSDHELKNEINKLTKEIAQKDKKLDKQEMALKQAKHDQGSLEGKLTTIKKKKKEVKEKIDNLKGEKTKLEAILEHEEKEIESLKQSAGKDSALIQEIIALKKEECEGIKEKVKSLEDKLESEKEKVTLLQEVKAELETLGKREQEIQSLEESSEEREKFIKEIISKGEQQVMEHKQQLKKVEEELEAQRREYKCLQERFEELTGKLNEKIVEVRAMSEIKEEIQSQLKQERERVDTLLRQSLVGKVPPDSQVMEMETTAVCEAQKISSNMAEPLHVQPLTQPLSLKWRKGKDLSFGVQCAHAVFLNEQVYIGGGAAIGDNKYLVMKYDPSSEECTELPRSTVSYYAMASVKDQLLLAGGGGSSTDIQLLDSKNYRWNTDHYPKIPTARSSPAALGYQNYLIVICGDYKDTVEILDCSIHKWYSAQSVPLRGDWMTAVIISDFVCISSYCWSDSQPHVFTAHLPTLISNAVHSTNAPLWQELPPPPVHGPTLLALRSHLLTMGGEGEKKDFYTFDSDNELWITCGQLPVEMYASSCTILPSGELFVAGGTVERVGQYSQQVWIGSLELL